MKIQYDVVQLLKSTDNYLPIADLERKLGISILGNADLYQALLKNTKLLFDSSTKTFRYRVGINLFVFHLFYILLLTYYHQSTQTPYDIRSKDDLLRVIREHYSERGMTVKELQDSWKGLLPAIQELEKDGYILTIRNKDNSPRVLFYNRIDLNTPTDEEFREIWKKTVLPHETDLPKELERAGLKTMEVFEKKTSAQASKAKGRRRGARKVKLTNTHIEGLDLTQDYVPVKKQ